MPADDDSSDLSSLSSLSPVPSEDELDELGELDPPGQRPSILSFFPRLSGSAREELAPPTRKRSPSPPHELVLADNPDIAFIVMFRSRFNDALPKSLAPFGPQELERDVVANPPGDRVEHFLCAVLGLLLNRKQDVKPGHYGRALEDAIASHKNQWPRAWEDKNPLLGGATFNTMTPSERLSLLRTFILWAMSSSEILKSLINLSYKQNRQDDDLNQPRSVQPWGSDGDKRRYFLIEGLDDTNFRVYRESNPQGTNRTWWSVASSIEGLRALSHKLDTKDGGPKAKKLSQKILGALPRFEAGEEVCDTVITPVPKSARALRLLRATLTDLVHLTIKYTDRLTNEQKRRRREYRQMQKERFKRPEPGFSTYEGRTRGKRIKYTYSDDEDSFLSDSTTRRSARNTGTQTPTEPAAVTTSSGRQIRAPPRLNTNKGDSAPASVKGDTPETDKEGSLGTTRRPRRAVMSAHGVNGWAGAERHSRYTTSRTSDEESEDGRGDDEEDADEHVPESEESEDEDEYDEEMGDDEMDSPPQTLMVKLSLTPPKLRKALTPIEYQATDHLQTPRNMGARPPGDNATGKFLEMKDAVVVRDRDTDAAPAEAGLGPSGPAEVFSDTAQDGAPVPVAQDEAEQSSEATHGATSLVFRASPEKPAAQSWRLIDSVTKEN